MPVTAEQEEWLETKNAEFLCAQLQKKLIKPFLKATYLDAARKWPQTPTEEQLEEASSECQPALVAANNVQNRVCQFWTHADALILLTVT